MGKNANRRYRGDNADIAKFVEDLAKFDKKASHKHLRARSLCTHCKSPTVTDLKYKEENGEIVWYCKICGERVDLKKIDDEKLKAAIQTVSQACNLIKIMSSGSERDQRIVREIVAEIQLKVNAYLYQLYKASLATSAKRKQHRGNGESGGSARWVGGQK